MSSQAKAASVFTVLIVTAVGLTVYGLARSGEADPLSTAHTVEIRQLEFRPAELTVTVGDTVVWVNRDIVPHTASALEGEWVSGELRNGESWRWIARVAGSNPYFCKYHPTMRGSISVR